MQNSLLNDTLKFSENLNISVVDGKLFMRVLRQYSIYHQVLQQGYVSLG